MSYANTGRVWTVGSFQEYLDETPAPSWAKAVCLHHTAAPSLAQRPKGFTIQHIINIRDFYKREKEWKSGPHFFTDEDQIFGMTPPTETGVHAVSFNSNSIGIEVLGDYDSESSKTGRGLECWRTTAAATKALLDWLKLPVNAGTVKFHRDDPKTTKTCPGTLVDRSWLIGLIQTTNPGKLAETKKTEEACNCIPIQYVVVATYLQEIKGYSSKEISNLLKKDAQGLFFFGDEWLEGAYYDKTKQATIAPIKELCTLPVAKKK